MGHNFSMYDSPSTDLKPGTYRIVNVASKTAIEALDKDRRKVVGWASSAQHDKHQMWFVQRAGRGYQFKNCHFGTYFCVHSADSNTALCASAYPIAWVLHLVQGEDTFVLQLPGNDRILNLDNGSKDNGTKISLQPTEDLPDRRRWRFEHISDESDTVDAVRSIRQELELLKQEHQSLKQEHQSLKREFQLQSEEIRELRHSDTKVSDEETIVCSSQNNRTALQ
ncbi:hypothetical protein BDV93DRAFT_519868 [Ceratobasidium sp. AG-I]|nr:hypothetical protein BDV93DRAFT_519868 [Ceratobasidium sp. AG-I]